MLKNIKYIDKVNNYSVLIHKGHYYVDGSCTIYISTNQQLIDYINGYIDINDIKDIDLISLSNEKVSLNNIESFSKYVDEYIELLELEEEEYNDLN